MQTFFRAIVMMVVLAAAWKGWQLYGPPTELLKSMAARVVAMADRALDGATDSDGATLDPDDPRTAAPAAAASLPAAPSLASATGAVEPFATAPASPPLLPTTTTETSPGSSAISAATASVSEDTKPASPFDSAAPGSAADVRESESQLEAILARLEELGIRDHQLESWGAAGELYRFSCRAPWGEAASFTRHFESVADQPLAAVEAVAAKVDAWRIAESGDRTLR